MTLLIKGGTLITACETFEADILIVGEQINQIGRDLSSPGAEILDVTGKLIMPGGVDPHVHLDLPMFNTVTSDDHYTGHRAAAFGGTTTALDFIPQEQNSLKEDIRAWHEKADHNAAIDFGFHMNITKFNEEIATEISGLPASGITSIKVFTAYNNRLRLDDGDIFKVMRIAKVAGILTLLHAENGDVIDVLVQEALDGGNT